MEILEKTPPDRPDGTITTIVRFLDDLGMIVVPAFDGYTPEEFYAGGVNKWGIDIWCSYDFAQLVELATKETDPSMPEQIHGWQSVIQASDEQIMQAYGGFVFKNVSRALRTAASLVHRQAQGQTGALLTNDFANIIHVQVGDKTWWIRAGGDSTGWSFGAGPLKSSSCWGADIRFFSDDFGT